MVLVRSVRTVTSTAAGSELDSVRQQLLDAVDHLDHVGARLALDVEDDAGGVVHPAGEIGVLGALRSTCATSDRRTGLPFL